MDGTDCTAEEMHRALEHSLGGLGNSVNDNNRSRILVSNKVAMTISYNHSYLTLHKIICRVQNNLQKILMP